MEPDKDNAGSKEQEYASFIEAITKASGELIPLPGRESPLGEKYIISARFGEDPTMPGIANYLNVDVFVEHEGDFVPIGIRDYEINDGIADGNKQRHQHLPAYNKAQENADDFWSTQEAIHVIGKTWLDYAGELGGLAGMSELRQRGLIKNEEQWNQPIYQRQGIGSMMQAVSLLVLKEKGVGELKTGSFTPGAEKTWGRFGVGEHEQVRTGFVASHPMVKRAITPFI